MEQLSKHVSTEMNTRNNRESVFSVRSVPRGDKEDKEDHLCHSSSGVPSEQLVMSSEDGVESSGVEC
jgi:hypothetical protein